MSRPFPSRRSSCWAIAALALFAATLSCSSSLEPRAPVSVLVTNATCATGQCAQVHLYAFPDVQTSTPGGPWTLDLGTTSAAQACFLIPPTATFRVVNEGVGQPADTTTFIWTNARSLRLGATSLSVSALGGVQTTAAFIPARAGGWSVTLPGTAAPVPAAACTP